MGLFDVALFFTLGIIQLGLFLLWGKIKKKIKSIVSSDNVRLETTLHVPRGR